MAVRIFLVKKDDPYASAEGMTELDKENAWRRYVASYTSVDPTEGVDPREVNRPMLIRNMKAMGADPDSDNFLPPGSSAHDGVATGVQSTAQTPAPDGASSLDGEPLAQQLLSRIDTVKNAEELTIRVAVNNYHILFQPGTSESSIQSLKQREGSEEGVKEAVEAVSAREEAMKEMLRSKELGIEEVDTRDKAFAEISGANQSTKAEVGDLEAAGGMEVDA